MKRPLLLFAALLLALAVGCDLENLDLQKPNCREVGAEAMRAYESKGEAASIKVLNENADECECRIAQNALSGRVTSIDCRVVD